MRLGQRLTRVEEILRGPIGCPTCRGWTGVVLEGEDGWHRPEQCPDCRRWVPATQVVQIVGVQIAAL